MRAQELSPPRRISRSVLDVALTQLRFAVIDVETTGLNPADDEIVELAVVSATGALAP